MELIKSSFSSETGKRLPHYWHATKTHTSVLEGEVARLIVENGPDKGKEFSISGRYDCNLQGSIFHTAHTLVQLLKKDFTESIKGFNEAIEENYRTKYHY